MERSVGTVMVVVVVIVFAFVMVKQDESSKRLKRQQQQEQQEFAYQQAAVVGKLLRGETLTLTELSDVGIVKIDAPALDQAITAYFKVQGIDPGGAEATSPARQQIDAFINYQIKLPPLQLPVATQPPSQ